MELRKVWVAEAPGTNRHAKLASICMRINKDAWDDLKAVTGADGLRLDVMDAPSPEGPTAVEKHLMLRFIDEDSLYLLFDAIRKYLQERK